MSEPFLSEIRIFGFTFAPRGWALCDGQILPINQYQSLYSLLGTTYGGDGRTTFGLPDLRGRCAVHPGSNGVTLGRKAGTETVTLSSAQIPPHVHDLATTDQARSNSPDATALASKARRGTNFFTTGSPTPLASDLQAGGGQAHSNVQPYTTLNFCIALQGLFPSRN